MPRPLTPAEQALLDGLVAATGVEALQVQARDVLASPGCTCGCGTLDLHVQGDPPRADVESPLSCGEVLDEQGRVVGGLLLFVEDGLLTGLEVYGYGDDPLPLPPPDRVDR